MVKPNMIPYEAWFGIRPSLAHTRIFECDTYIHVLKEKRNKLQSKSQFGMFLGYFDESKAYHIWNKVTHKVCVTHDIIFHKNVTSMTSSIPATTYAQLPPSGSSLSSTSPTLTVAATSIQDTGENLNWNQNASSSSSHNQPPEI